jgi:hypothetical protein
MSKVIVERPRVGGNGCKENKGYKKKLQRSLREESDNLVSYETSGRRRKFGWNAKEFSERLGPLRKFLRTRVGCAWNDVWSEICESLRVDSAVQSHVRDHVGWEVEQHVVMINGKPYLTTKDMEVFSRFYVNPDTGILCENPRKRFRRQKRKPNFVPGKDNLHQYRIIDNIWYEIKLTPFPPMKMFPTEHERMCSDRRFMNTVRDVILAPNSTGFGAHRADCERVYGAPVHAVNKRQLNSREIKSLKLWEKFLQAA